MQRNLGKVLATLSIIGLLAGAGPGTIRAADYVGASAVLQTVEARHAQPEKSAGTNDSTLLQADLKAFGQHAGALPPAEAASQWLGLVDRWARLQSEPGARQDFEAMSAGGNGLLGALPPPAAWGELAKAVARRPAVKGNGEIREIGLRFLAALLTGDTNAQGQVIATLSEKARAAGSMEGVLYGNYLRQIGQTMLENSDNPDAILALLNNQLDSATSGGQQSISVPNLVAQVGRDRAKAFLRRALLTPNVTLNFNDAGETCQLAQNLARELMPQLKSPHWELINSLDAVDLYEAMDRQFSAPTNAAALPPGISIPGMRGLPNLANLPNMADFYGNSDRSQARIYYLLGLISENRTADAVAVAKKIKGQNSEYLSDEAFKAMEHAGYTEALDNFLYDLLSQNPALPFWDRYVNVAAQAGKTERMVALVRTTLDHADMSESQKARLQQILFKALLAADKVDEAVPEIRRLAAADSPPAPGQAFTAGDLGVVLARVGFLLKQPDWTDEGIGITKKWLAKNAAAGGPGGVPSEFHDLAVGEAGQLVGPLAQILFELNRGPEAESLLTDALAATTAPTGDGDSGGSWQSTAAQAILAELAVLYHKAGRYEDVLNLLQQSPNWGAGDLGDLFDASTEEPWAAVMFLHTGSSPLPVPFLAANALLATGQKETARKILGPLQDRFPGLDRCYELLIALDGTNAIPQLDAWFKRDQFEERPLIWKAHLLRQENRLEEAEKTIRQAVAIDPSDGEEGRGDRMRAYAELAEIRAARGDQKEADFYREIVKAIRLSEDADQFYQAGMLKRAIAMYQEGLDHFADAYCIQSRLAIQLSALGQNAAAEEHYRRAYELMPDSFGRVESHCFGCEKAFDGARAQNLAEQVFTKCAAEHPKKPQVYYLLGYLHGEEERYNEARTNYLMAVRLDPDYLNAWVKLQEVSQQLLVPADERNEIAFNILRLDPLRRHAQAGFGNVSDLAGLWKAGAVAAAQQLAPVSDLFPLTASKMALAKKTSAGRQGDVMIDFFHAREASNTPVTPAALVSGTPFVALAGQMIMNRSVPDE